MRITKKPDERREEIIQAARELFAANGFVKTTISDIAKKIGIAKGLFYYYFQTKDDVMNAVIDNYVCATSDEIREITRREDLDFLERLNRIIFTIINFSRDAENMFAELKKTDRFMFHQSILEHAVAQYMQLIAGMVEEGVEKGIIRCKHPQVTVGILFYGFGMMDFTSMDQSEIVEIVEQALAIDKQP